MQYFFVFAFLFMTSADVHLFVSVQALADETKYEQVSDALSKDMWKLLYSLTTHLRAKFQ